MLFLDTLRVNIHFGWETFKYAGYLRSFYQKTQLCDLNFQNMLEAVRLSSNAFPGLCPQIIWNYLTVIIFVLFYRGLMEVQKFNVALV